MKKLLFIAALMLSLPLMAQNTDAKYVTQLGTYIKGSESFLNANKLSSAKMRKMLIDTYTDKKGSADFTKALNKYFAGQYDKDLAEVLSSYYGKNVTAQQLDELINGAKSDGVKRAIDGLAKCDDANYRDKMVDETLTSVAQKTGKKKKKKNLKKFKSDCTEDYRAALTSYTTATDAGSMAEDKVNAIYHTVAIDDLNAYTAYMGSDAMASSRKAETAVADDIYNVQVALLDKFQTWTYKAYPSLFTKKQTVQKKRGKGKKGKKTSAQQDTDAVIDGGIYH